MEPMLASNIYILQWHPSDPRLRVEDLAGEIDSLGPKRLSWEIREWQTARKHDEFFLIRCGEAPTGIVMHGSFCSEPYPVGNRNGEPEYRIDIEPDIIINPRLERLLSVEALEAIMPYFWWDGGACGRILPDAYRFPLLILWYDYLRKIRQ